MSHSARSIARVFISMFVGRLGLLVLPSVRNMIGCVRRGQFSVGEIAYVGLAVLVPIAILSYWKEGLAARLLIASGLLAFLGTAFERCNWTAQNKSNAAIGLVLYAALIAAGWWLKVDADVQANRWPKV